MSDYEDDNDDIVREFERRDEEEQSDSDSDNDNENVTSTKKSDNKNGTNKVLDLSDDEAEEASDKEDDKDDNKKKDDKDDDKKKKTERKKTKNILTLNIEKLKHKDKGIHRIENYFENFKFLGKGHEKQDLDRVMKRLEHWAHRMFPKYGFDDCLQKIEQIGIKKQMNAFIEKYRTDMLTEDDQVHINDEDDEVNDGTQSTIVHDDFDDIMPQHQELRKQLNERTSQVTTPKPATVLSDEVKAMIERKRLEALEKKKAREEARLLEESEKSASDAAHSANDSQQNVTANSSHNVEKELTLQEMIEKKKQMAIQRKLERQREREKEMMKSQNLIAVETDYNHDEIIKENNEKTVTAVDVPNIDAEKTLETEHIQPSNDEMMEIVQDNINVTNEDQRIENTQEQCSKKDEFNSEVRETNIETIDKNNSQIRVDKSNEVELPRVENSNLEKMDI